MPYRSGMRADVQSSSLMDLEPGSSAYASAQENAFGSIRGGFCDRELSMSNPPWPEWIIGGDFRMRSGLPQQLNFVMVGASVVPRGGVAR